MLLLLALLKLPIAALMFWIPMHYDQPVQPVDSTDSSDEDGGSKALPGGPLNRHPRGPRPRSPRRGPHGSPSSPPRTRTPWGDRPPLRVNARREPARR